MVEGITRSTNQNAELRSRALVVIRSAVREPAFQFYSDTCHVHFEFVQNENLLISWIHILSVYFNIVFKFQLRFKEKNVNGKTFGETIDYWDEGVC